VTIRDLPATRRRNDATLALAGDSESFFFPVCSVHPGDGEEALAEIERVAAAGRRQVWVESGGGAAWQRRGSSLARPARP
jgi:predicted TIM-barrel fold metal-dependent hydrolase